MKSAKILRMRCSADLERVQCIRGATASSWTMAQNNMLKSTELERGHTCGLYESSAEERNMLVRRNCKIEVRYMSSRDECAVDSAKKIVE